MRPSRLIRLPSLPALLRVLGVAVLGLLPWLASAGPAAALPVGADGADLWPGVTVFHDADHALRLPDMLARRGAFSPPRTPYANLGRTPDTVWLKIVLQVAAGQTPDWWFTADYVSLDEVEVFVLRGDATLQRVLLGDALPLSQRPFPGRTHMAMLHLPAGEPIELMVRVRTTSTMIVPLSLRHTVAMVHDESGFQAWHGMTLGFALCVLAFGLTGVITTRDSLYVWFSWSVTMGSLFFFAYFGLAQQYLWPEHPWLVQNAAPLLMLLMLVGGLMFAERSLDVRALSPRLGHAMQVVAGLVLVLAGLFAAGLMTYHAAVVAASLLGPWPMLLSVSVAVRRARRGDAAARWTIAGWLIYAVGVGVATALNAGHADATPLVQEAYLGCALLQIVAWVMVMNVRVAELRQQAAEARRETDRAHILSRTDALTGLLNRRGLHVGLQPLIDQSVPGRLTAVYLLDLDDFKPVNDRHGHDAGDALLVQVADRLKQAVRSNDLVARLGGDEFVIVASQLGGEVEAARVAQKLLACVEQPFDVAQARCEVGLTVGYALAGQGDDPAAVLRRADAAMYSGKQAGRRCVRRALEAA